jgi:ribosomal-protein-alanine N-acetyltransferase
MGVVQRSVRGRIEDLRSVRTTPRLLLSIPCAADVIALFRFLGDRDAMRYTHVVDDLASCRHLVETHESQRETVGCAPWVVRERETGEIVGWGGLYEDPFDRGWGIELAFFFAPRAWGRGLATELAEVALSIARDELGLAKVSAFAHPENARSHSVLRKAGFREQRFIPHMTRHLYERSL